MNKGILYQVKDLNFFYARGIKALQEINIDIYPGEFLVFLGINGSGKTTILHHLCRLLTPQAGEVLLWGKDISKYAEKELYQKVNMVFQDPHDQLFCTTVGEDISFGPRNLNLEKPEIERRRHMALKMVGLDGFEQRYIHELSFGEKKRVALAGALAMGSHVLLLDEPTSGIDPLGASEIFQMLHNYNRRYGITVIMATQDVDMIPVYASRVALLINGRIETVAPVKELFGNPEILRRSHMRLPRVAHLMEILDRKYSLGNKPYPLTIGEACQQVLELIASKRSDTINGGDSIE